MKPINILGLTAAAAVAIISAVFVALPAAPALAQSGSRLCGYSAPAQAGSYIGLLYEARQDDLSYDDECDEAISKAWKKIQDDPQLKALTWTKHHKTTCEDVGVHFESTNSDKDMCDNMKAHEGYLVKKAPDAQGVFTTSYDKQ